VSDQPPTEWKNTHSGGPPPAPATPTNWLIVWGVLVGAAAGVFAVVALSLWGGLVGRVIVAAVGFCVAGAVLPWLCMPAISGNDSTIGCILGTLSVICAVVGLGVGIWFGLASTEGLEWWAYAGSGTLSALAGGIVGGLAAAWASERKKGGNPPA